MAHSRAERRKNDWKKAIRKHNIVVSWGPNWRNGWYDDLHRYCDGKIHCSCSLCAAKTRNHRPTRSRFSAPGINYCMMDRRRMDEMDGEEEEFYSDVFL